MKKQNGSRPDRSSDAIGGLARAGALIVPLALLGSGCATSNGGNSFASASAPHRSRDGGASRIAREAIKDSSVDISYVLGHSHRKLVAWAKNDTFGGRTLLDQQVVHESALDRARYSELFGKVEEFVAKSSSMSRKPGSNATTTRFGAGNASTLASNATDPGCRTPFTVTLRVGTDSQVLQGCRGSDDGSLGLLLREGEFLLLSK